MEKVMNWDDVTESNFIDKEGRYTLKVKSFTTGTSANGKEFHKFECETQDKEKITTTFYLVENALWKYKNFVKACGVPAQGVVNFDTLPQTLVGRKFIGEVKRQPAKPNVVTGVIEESKYFEVAKFFPVED